MYLYNHSGKTNVYEEQQIDVDELDSCDGDIDALIAQEWTAAAGILISLLIDHHLGQKIFGATVIGKLVFNSKSRGNIPRVCSTKYLSLAYMSASSDLSDTGSGGMRKKNRLLDTRYLLVEERPVQLLPSAATTISNSGVTKMSFR